MEYKQAGGHLCPFFQRLPSHQNMSLAVAEALVNEDMCPAPLPLGLSLLSVADVVGPVLLLLGTPLGVD